MQKMLIPDNSHMPRILPLWWNGFYFPTTRSEVINYDWHKALWYKIGFAIADVSGKGISAASWCQISRQHSGPSSPPISILYSWWTSQFGCRFKCRRWKKFITFFICRYDSNTKVLEYINAAITSCSLWHQTGRVTHINAFMRRHRDARWDSLSK